MEVANQL